MELQTIISLIIVGLVVFKVGRRVFGPAIAAGLELARPAIAAGLELARRAAGQVTRAAGQVTVLPPAADSVTALESQVTTLEQVTSLELSHLEIAWIAHGVGAGQLPSAIAKTLPGYTPKKYAEYAARVGQVEALLAEKHALELARLERRQARAGQVEAGTSTKQEHSVVHA
jgi:hypothetical protein